MRYGHVKSRYTQAPNPHLLSAAQCVQEQCGALLSGLRAPRLDSTFGCDLGAELRKGMLVPDGDARGACATRAALH